MSVHARTGIPHATPTRRAPPTCMVVGVGGQGVMHGVQGHGDASAQRQGLQVKQSEVHGMAKRGGVGVQPRALRRRGSLVADHRPRRRRRAGRARMGRGPALAADHLRIPTAAVLIADTKRIVPPFACRDRQAVGAALELPRYAQRRKRSPPTSPDRLRARRRPGMATGAKATRAPPTPCCSACSPPPSTIPAADWLSRHRRASCPPKTRRHQPRRAWTPGAPGR
jgi:indolepyruvate ferredoxin oxidoreductase beta subunit